MTMHSSACPANTEDEGVEMGTKEQNEDFRHTDFDDEAKPEAQVPPPRKRPRDIAGGGQTSGTSRAPTRKKQVRGKQGRLAGLMNMPIDIFTEVRRVACISVWQSIHVLSKHAHASVVNPHLAWIDEERGGLAAMSTGHERTTLPVVTIFKDVLEMRETCKGKNGWKAARAAVLVSVNGVPLSIRSFVHRSWQIFPPGQKLRCYNQYVLSADVPGLLTEYEDMKQVNDKGALEAWTKARIAEVGQRRGESEALARFLDNLDNNREKELDELKEARRSEIERRVRELGWADEDIPSDWESEHHHAWNALINQPKPLTDRIWANLQPKLIPLLEARRVERLEAEHEERKSRRQDRLVKLFKEIKEKVCSPLLFIVPEFGLFPGSTRTYEVVDPHHVFPNLDYALAWPIVKNLYEADSTPEEMEAMFETHREEIEALVNEWRISVQGYFVKQAEANGAGLRPVLTNYYGDSGPYIHFSDDLKRLQRADSIFYTTSSSENQKSPLMYRSILCAEGLTWSSPTSPHASFPKSPTLEHIFWYPEAHEVARALLVNMGKPDVPYLEIRGYPVTHIYSCGRCHDTGSKTWVEMIQHYVEQKQMHSDAQKDLKDLVDQAIIYNDIHDPALNTALPMIEFYDPQAQFEARKIRNEGSGLQVCKVCEKIPSAGEVVASRSSILRHLLNVHDITKPEVDEHYTPQRVPSPDL